MRFCAAQNKMFTISPEVSASEGRGRWNRWEAMDVARRDNATGGLVPSPLMVSRSATLDVRVFLPSENIETRVQRGRVRRDSRPSIEVCGAVRNGRFVCGRRQDVSGIERLERKAVALARGFGAPGLRARARYVAGSAAGAYDPGFISSGAQDAGLGEASLKPRGGAICFGAQTRKPRLRAVCPAAVRSSRTNSNAVRLSL